MRSYFQIYVGGEGKDGVDHDGDDGGGGGDDDGGTDDDGKGVRWWRRKGCL